ncbi:MAG: branched-chain amino acid ABC transporter permease [Rhodospirillaceae bacterium]|jgi:branched-chain amino acid transport system permease protein|nr:branched-chain amino acid ABC transporter permease [Rhodospirillaceae bacterium]MBT3492629.1 branched-chain amino acid ABC transporter permease [Rhodospirillaceae bacterium]MBT3782498.1 branched-chain amino acid ABC transporter permease [Rhodospirillaceae bacterium]MBT3978627.1 branched-chain amino acid ABC transporter permease [Rhodospirillaceae bacterium]MBT4167084.1 branched-chain amino acid ABC transporter permease [Rhodospirillaceae bacterium]
MFAEFTEALFSIFFIETLINGLLLGGVLALLSLGLNLIFGVIDVVWICYAEIIMLGMYTIYFLHVDGGMPLILAAACGVGVTALLGWLTHRLVIGYLLQAAPINQLLATGGLLFFFQGAAMVAFGIEFRNLGVSLGSLALSEDIYLSWTRLLSFAIAAGVVVVLYQFLSRSYLGAAIRAISQDREIMILMGVNTKKLYLLTSAIGGGLAGLAAALLALQYDVHPFIGLSFGPITFMVCVMGGLGNMVGGFLAAFVFSELITIGGYFAELEWGYVLAFAFFIFAMFIRPEGLFARKS